MSEQEYSTVDFPTVSKPKENEQKFSWFSSIGLSPNLTNQLSNLSTSIIQVTSKVGTAANTFVQKSFPQRPSTPNENEQQPTTTENKEGQQTSETNKDLTSILNNLGLTVLKGAQQLKQAVEEKSLIGNFTKEHEKFLTEKRTQKRHEETAVLPWIGYKQEEEMEQQILALSKDKRNFLRSPPTGANYHFDMASAYPVALATLEVDENLRQMRFDLVPKQVNEEAFWRNYFYRVSLIQQSSQLSALANENINNQSTNETNISSNDHTRRTSDLHEKISDVNQEFVSEDYDTSAVNIDDIRREIEQLSLIKSNSNKGKASSPDLDESEWDKGLTDELENISAEELEAQINQMLAGDSK